MSIALVTVPSIVDGMIAALASIAIPASPALSPQGAYLRVVERYRGEFAEDQAELAGVAGRTPAVLVAFAGEQVRKRMAVGTFAHVETTLVAFVCFDTQRTRSARDADFYRAMIDVRRLLGGRRFALNITPLGYDGTTQVVERSSLTAWGVRFKTRYHIDTSRPPAVQEQLLSLSGVVTDGGQTTYGTLKAT